MKKLATLALLGALAVPVTFVAQAQDTPKQEQTKKKEKKEKKSSKKKEHETKTH